MRGDSEAASEWQREEKGRAKWTGSFCKMTAHVQEVDACFVTVVKLSQLSRCLDANMWFLAAEEGVALVMTSFTIARFLGLMRS